MGRLARMVGSPPEVLGRQLLPIAGASRVGLVPTLLLVREVHWLLGIPGALMMALPLALVWRLPSALCLSTSMPPVKLAEGSLLEWL